MSLLPLQVSVRQEAAGNAGGDEKVRRKHEKPQGCDVGVGVRQSQVRGHRELGEQTRSTSLGGAGRSADDSEALDLMPSKSLRKQHIKTDCLLYIVINKSTLLISIKTIPCK